MNYRNFDIEAYEYRDEGGTARFKVRVANSPAGQQRLADAADAALDLARLKPALSRLERRDLDRAAMIELGAQLGDALFPPPARRMLEVSRAALQDDESLRVRMRFDVVGLSSLPWEYLHVPKPDARTDRRSAEGFLALDRSISLVRYEVMQQAPGTLDPLPGAQLRMVALFSDPKSPDFPALDLSREADNIRAALADAPAVRADIREHATLEVLQDALTQPAHIFHFGGHGDFEAGMGEKLGEVSGSGFLVLVGEDGGAFRYGAERLANRLNRRGVRLAVLGACQGGRRDGLNPWTGVAPALARTAEIPAVVAMQLSIRDGNAIAFSRRFYHALAQGQSIDLAVSDGRLAIFDRSDDDERDWGVPVLYMRADEGTLFPQAGTAVGSSVEQAIPPKSNDRLANTATTMSTSTLPDPDQVTLRKAMAATFKPDELEVLCADLSAILGANGIREAVSMADVGASGSLQAQILNLIGYCQRRGWYAYLVQAVRAARPNIGV